MQKRFLSRSGVLLPTVTIRRLTATEPARAAQSTGPHRTDSSGAVGARTSVSSPPDDLVIGGSTGSRYGLDRTDRRDLSIALHRSTATIRSLPIWPPRTGTPVARRGRKATGLTESAGSPNGARHCLSGMGPSGSLKSPRHSAAASHGGAIGSRQRRWSSSRPRCSCRSPRAWRPAGRRSRCRHRADQPGRQ